MNIETIFLLFNAHSLELIFVGIAFNSVVERYLEGKNGRNTKDIHSGVSHNDNDSMNIQFEILLNRFHGHQQKFSYFTLTLMTE